MAQIDSTCLLDALSSIISGMVSVYDIKPKFQDLLRPVCAKLAALGVTANQVTIIALLMSVVYGILLMMFPQLPWLYYLMPIVLFKRMALNAIDGMLAREHNMKSKLGGILNELADVLSDIFLYLPFCTVTGVSSELVIVIVLLAVIVEFTGVLGFAVGSTRHYDGPMGKSDRAVAFGVLALFIASETMNPQYALIFLLLLITLSIMTILNRVKSALREGPQ